MQHLEEGTIHAWLDGELSAEAAAAAEAHARECAECSALVAEARGLIAASTRILTALDDVPSGVIPAAPRKRHWYDRTDIRAAAAVLFVAGASLVVLQSRDAGVALKSVAVSDRAAPLTSPVESSVGTGSSAAAEAPQQQLQQRMSEPSVASAAKQSEDDAARLETQPKRESRDRAMNKAVAQNAPPPVIVGPQTMITSAETATGMRAGALMDFSRAKGAASNAGRIEGRITDQSREKGIAGANVMVQGTSLSVATDNEGKFRIDNVPAGEQRLIVRRSGYDAQTIPLSVKDSAVTTNVALAPSPAGLGEAVVTGVPTATAMRVAGAAKAAPALRQLRSDSTGSTRRTVYEYSPGVEITLVESPDVQLNARRDERAADAAAALPAPAAPPAAQARQAINTIRWTDRGRRYTLSGPLATGELEALKARLMTMRR